MSAGKEHKAVGAKPRDYTASIDTRAQGSVVTQRVVGDLMPSFGGIESLARAGNDSTYADTYYLRVRIGGSSSPGDWIHVVAFMVEPATPGVDVILGMDVLRKTNIPLDGGRLGGVIGRWRGDV